MRASTLFALTAAIVLGLAVATAAKYTGYFSAPAATAQPAPKKAEVQALVAARNLFAGDLIEADGLRVRTLRAEELEDYQKNKDQYMPAVVQAGALRVAQKNIVADQPILKDYLKDMAKPDSLSVRLLPQMRAVTLSLPKERSVGGQVQVGEWVDIFLTSEIEGSHQKVVRTAAIATKARVIAKRNTLWQVFKGLPEDKPVSFTVELNPYRAALIESTRSKGDFAIVPLGKDEQRLLEAQRERMVQAPGPGVLMHFLPPDSPEAAEEDARVAAFGRGELVISEMDLMRIFGLQTPPPPLATNNVQVERISGAHRLETAVFSPAGVLLNGRGTAPASYSDRNINGQADSFFQFRIPDCPTCGVNKGKKTTK
jgi:Flp pilus assembly protein CpaB